MKLANIATVKVGSRLELHLKFNHPDDLVEAYAQITRGELAQAEPSIHYTPLYDFATKHHVSYNELCNTVRAALEIPE